MSVALLVDFQLTQQKSAESRLRGQLEAVTQELEEHKVLFTLPSLILPSLPLAPSTPNFKTRPLQTVFLFDFFFQVHISTLAADSQNYQQQVCYEYLSRSVAVCWSPKTQILR